MLRAATESRPRRIGCQLRGRVMREEDSQAGGCIQCDICRRGPRPIIMRARSSRPGSPGAFEVGTDS